MQTHLGGSAVCTFMCKAAANLGSPGETREEGRERYNMEGRRKREREEYVHVVIKANLCTD